MLLESTDFIIGFIFGLLGFVISCFVSRSLNIIIFGGFMFAILKAMEALQFATDWNLFDRFVTKISELGEVSLSLVSSMLLNANEVSLILFVFGGVSGLFMRKRSI